MRIARKCGGCLGQAIGKIPPDYDPGHVKEKFGETVSRQLGNIAEYDGEDPGGHERLDQIPDRPKDCLLILGNEIAMKEKQDQIPEPPQFLEFKVKPAALRFYDLGPGFGAGSPSEMVPTSREFHGLNKGRGAVSLFCCICYGHGEKLKLKGAGSSY